MRVLDLFHSLKPSTYVERIPNAMTHDFILNRHYARRLPSITYAFGLFYDGCLEGICTFGTPSSAPLRTGICGKEFSHLVIELNRLFLLNNKRNDASRLIGASLRMLPKPMIVVSFADPAHGHTGGYIAPPTLFTAACLQSARIGKCAAWNICTGKQSRTNSGAFQTGRMPCGKNTATTFTWSHGPENTAICISPGRGKRFAGSGRR